MLQKKKKITTTHTHDACRPADHDDPGSMMWHDGWLLVRWTHLALVTLQKENALFILNSSAHVLSATNRFDPECEPHLDEVLNQESARIIRVVFSIVSLSI